MAAAISTLQKALQMVARIKIGKEPGHDQLELLENLSSHLVIESLKLRHHVRERKKVKWEEILHKAKQKVKAAEQSQQDIQLGHIPKFFRQNIRQIFLGAERHPEDGPAGEQKKHTTDKRAGQLRKLQCGKLLTWATSYPASSWLGGKMGEPEFQYLYENIAATCPRGPFMGILEDLHNNSLQNSTEYGLFFNGWLFQNHFDYANLKIAVKETGSVIPAPVQTIHPPDLPEPDLSDYTPFAVMCQHKIGKIPDIRTYVLRSKRWVEERAAALTVTNCITLYVPQDPDQDYLFLAKISKTDGLNVLGELGIGDIDGPFSYSA